MNKKEMLEYLEANPGLFAQLFPNEARELFAPAIAETKSYAGYPKAQNPYQQKHGTVADLSNQMPGPLNEEGFFVDCALAAPVINTTIFPISSFVNVLPVRPSIIESVKFGFITGLGDGDVGTEPDFVCDEPPTLDESIDACKIEYNFGRRARQTKTGELDDLIKRACRGLYDDFYFVGDAGFSGRRGISDQPTQLLTFNDRDFILASAVRKQLGFLGRNFQRWMMKTIWTGDGTIGTTNGGYREFWGFLNLIRDDYGANNLPLEVMNQGADCSALNSCVIDFEGQCICTGNRSLYEEMQEAEAEIYDRGDLMGLLPISGYIVMPHIHWSEFVKCLPCEMIANGCQTPGNTTVTTTINLDNVNADLEARNQFMANRRIMLNSRVYEVMLDSSLPITETQVGDAWHYASSILFIPLTVAGGEWVTYLEHVDYTKIAEELAPLPNEFGLAGWTDGGKHHVIANVNRRCFNVDIKTEPRLVFKAPHLSWRIDQVTSCQSKRRSSARVNQ